MQTDTAQKPPLFSIIIPLYNRPEEIDELLESLASQTAQNFTVLIVEDGSTKPGKAECEKWADRVPIQYEVIDNQGPAGARNHGVQTDRSEAPYVIFFDSDCLIPPDYMQLAEETLATHQDIDLWGGPDASHPSFSPIQKAISYSMTSPLSTGGIRGGSEKSDRFYPRTFNLGIRREAFIAIGGFSAMRYGEDVDLSMRAIEAGYKSALLPSLFVYHKRRNNFRSFFRQVMHSGTARVDLARRHPGTLKPIHTLPALCVIFLAITLIFSWHRIAQLALFIALIYPLAIFVHATFSLRSVKVGFLSAIACCVQIIGYGWGFLKGLGRKRGK